MERGGPMMPYPPQIPMQPIPYMPMPMKHHHHYCMVDVHKLHKAYHHSKKTTKMLKKMMMHCHHCYPYHHHYHDPCGCGCESSHTGVYGTSDLQPEK